MGRYNRGFNRAWFGTVTRAIKDHERTLITAALILEAECGVVHQPGERTDLCPKCKQVVEAEHKEAGGK